MNDDSDEPSNRFYELNANSSECSAACDDCERQCRAALVTSRLAGGAVASLDHLRLLEDCAEVCRLTARALERGSAFIPDVCRLTAEVCRATAESCRRFELEILDACADACDRAYASCRALSVAMTWRDAPLRGSREVDRPIH